MSSAWSALQLLADIAIEQAEHTTTALLRLGSTDDSVRVDAIHHRQQQFRAQAKL